MFLEKIYINKINMLRIAVQSKGRLYDETMLLLEEAGIKLNRGKRILLLSAKGFPVEIEDFTRRVKVGGRAGNESENPVRKSL